ncbi:MAG: 3-isopropylmalate dehydratase large subunit [Elusimicrobiota bacterium]|nr:3-isopropylmalate dehydratase large subunit [Elusimicrobiota bacterium]
MPHTITEKILAIHSGKKEVFPGEFILSKVNVALSNDITSPIAIEEFKRIGTKEVFSRDKVVIVLDHFTPNKDIQAAEQCAFIREFAKEQKLKYFYDAGLAGIEHALLPEEGLVTVGSVIVGADSHTCTYGALGAFATGVGSTDIAAVWSTGKIWLKVPPSIKFVYTGVKQKWVYGKDIILYTISKIDVDGASYCAMEFTGEVIKNMSVSERFTMCNMSIEAGAKSGIIEPDKVIWNYLRQVQKHFQSRHRSRSVGKSGGLSSLLHYPTIKSDKNAKYSDVIEIDVSKLKPVVALPHLPSNIKPVEEINNVIIDQVVIGSCTNGYLEDLRIAAKILKNKKVHPYVRLLIFPATRRIYRQALKEGLIETFLDAGGVVNPPTCGPCLGGHLGVLAKDEKCVATTNRNFVGRMGDIKSDVYLANPAVAAASAIKGRIAHPNEV